MKRFSFLTILAVFVITAQAQKFSGKVVNHEKGEMDVVLTMFGLEKLVKIGTLSADGTLEIDLSDDPTGILTNEEREFYIDRLVYGFQYVCGNPDDFPEGEPKIARDAGFIALWANNQWSGSLFPVTDEKLKLWMEDDGYNDAVEASFYKVLLVTEDVELKKQCNNYDYYNEKDVEVNLDYDIRLKKGLNLVEYQIQSVFKTNPDVRASFPEKVKMTNPVENPPIIWMASYFW
ncbi:hypothetical protein [Mariniphaga sp.]|uniref:hypothetical protein n=1 Tax=Mariniphaga sp. TaxID=1954475 RepID=UPI003568CC55